MAIFSAPLAATASTAFIFLSPLSTLSLLRFHVAAPLFIIPPPVIFFRLCRQRAAAAFAATMPNSFQLLDFAERHAALCRLRQPLPITPLLIRYADAADTPAGH